MLQSRTSHPAIVVVLLACVCIGLAAAPSAPTTTIHVKNMHCGHCAQKIARKLYTVASVKKVKTDVKQGTAVITPEATRQPSPKALWEAVEKAGFKPVKLTTPEASFEEKPEA